MIINNLFIKQIIVLYILLLLVITSLSIYPQQDSASANTTLNNTIKDSIITDIHPQDVSKDAGFIIENFGGLYKLKIYGSVRISGVYDLNGLTNANSFSTYDIIVGNGSKAQPRFFMSPYQTRLGLEVTKASFVGTVKLKIETDFLGVNNGLRIRHAYVESGNFIVGQTWSTFTDVNSVPATVDIDGPNSSVILRTVKLRYSNIIFENNFKYIVSLETPDPDVNVPDSLSDRVPSQFLPDFAGQLIHNYYNGYLTLCAILRGITVKDSSGTSEQIFGYGLLLAGVYNLDEKNKFLFQGVYGSAISRFITALKGKGLDLILNPAKQTFEAANTFGFLLSYSHKWRDDISSALTLGIVDLKNKDFEPADAFSQSWYYSANIFWNALAGMRLGLEFSQGRRINKDSAFGEATRMGFTFYSDF